MKFLRHILVSGAILLAILVIALPLLAVFYSGFVVDIWWYNSLGYGFYFWQRLLYNYVVFFVATALFFVFFYSNFRIAARYLNATRPSEIKRWLRWKRRKSPDLADEPPNADKQEAATAEPAPKPKNVIVRLMTRVSLWMREHSKIFYGLLSLVLAVIVAAPLYREWEATLLFVFAPAAGIADPVYGKDISYYLFALPLFRLILNEVFVVLLVLFVGVSALYYLERRSLAKRNLQLPTGAKKHLSVILALIFIVALAELIFQRHLLLYTDSHLPLFYGPGYTEMTVILPLIWAAIISLVLFAISFIWYFNRGKGLPLMILFGVLLGASIGVRYWSALPQAVQDYIVEPDELARQEPYIRYNIAATLDAFDLANVETRPYVAHVFEPGAEQALTTESTNISLRNIPVWDREMLLGVYRELQELRTYYRFLKVDIDRYTIDDMYQQVFLSARELDFNRLPEDSQNWINRWFKYTHGYGAVMSAAAQIGEEPKDWFLKDIPPESDYGMVPEESAIYFGMEDLYDVIAPNRLGEISYPGPDGVVIDDYRGNGGIPIHNWFRRAVFAIYYRDYRLFFSTAIAPDSQILIRRNVPSTIQMLTPFFELDGDPYLVVTPERLYWIQDAYTVSDRYPYAEPVNHAMRADQIPEDDALYSPIADNQLNYIRNSVKIVVDAYDGEMHYYLADPSDPIARAYRRMYPGLIKTMDRLPEALKPHLRYPSDLFQTQMEVYAKYHQTDPAVFYGQEDRWVFPRLERQHEIKTVTPYYVTLNLIDKERFEHLLLVPMNPAGRENMRAIAVAGSDGDNYGRIFVYSFPMGALIHGLSQIEALIEQDAAIAEQFTLWGQGGAQVERGNLILVLVDGVLTYVQPVYLKAARGVQIPQLKRIIVSQRGQVAMERSLEESFEALRLRKASRTRRPRAENSTQQAPEL